MKILWIAPFPIPSSKVSHPAPWLTSLLVNLTNKENVIVDLLTISSYIVKEEKHILSNNSVLTVIPVPKTYSDMLFAFKRRINKINKYLRKHAEKYDIIHIHGTENCFQEASKLINRPVVISIQGIISECIKYLPEYISLRKLAWLSISRYEKKNLSNFRYFSVRTAWDYRYVKTYSKNSFTFNIFEVVRAEFFSFLYNIKSNNIMFTGGTNPLKGIEEAITIYTKSKMIVDINQKLIIAGGCNQRYLEKLIKRFKLQENDLIITGMVNAEKLIELYKSTAIMLHPSKIDNSPNSICEAQVAGIPIIARRTGGVPSLIDGGKTGFLYDTINEAIEKTIFLLKNVDERLKISSASKKIAAIRHNPDKIASQNIDMYMRIISDYSKSI